MKEETIMKEFVYSYPMKVYFGEGAARKAIAAEVRSKNREFTTK